MKAQKRKRKQRRETNARAANENKLISKQILFFNSITQKGKFLIHLLTYKDKAHDKEEMFEKA
jgi:hypothetical protein